MPTLLILPSHTNNQGGSDSQTTHKTPEMCAECECCWNRPGYFLRSASDVVGESFPASENSEGLIHVTKSSIIEIKIKLTYAWAVPLSFKPSDY
jgi:hypothetical protein